MVQGRPDTASPGDRLHAYSQQFTGQTYGEESKVSIEEKDPEPSCPRGQPHELDLFRKS